MTKQRTSKTRGSTAEVVAPVSSSDIHTSSSPELTNGADRKWRPDLWTTVAQIIATIAQVGATVVLIASLYVTRGQTHRMLQQNDDSNDTFKKAMGMPQSQPPEDTEVAAILISTPQGDQSEVIAPGSSFVVTRHSTLGRFVDQDPAMTLVLSELNESGTVLSRRLLPAPATQIACWRNADTTSLEFVALTLGDSGRPTRLYYYPREDAQAETWESTDFTVAREIVLAPEQYQGTHFGRTYLTYECSVVCDLDNYHCFSISDRVFPYGFVIYDNQFQEILRFWHPGTIGAMRVCTIDDQKYLVIIGLNNATNPHRRQSFSSAIGHRPFAAVFNFGTLISFSKASVSDGGCPLVYMPFIEHDDTEMCSESCNPDWEHLYTWYQKARTEMGLVSYHSFINTQVYLKSTSLKASAEGRFFCTGRIVATGEDTTTHSDPQYDLTVIGSIVPDTLADTVDIQIRFANETANPSQSNVPTMDRPKMLPLDILIGELRNQP